MSAPEPSPAFTIDFQPPGFYPPTPATEDLPASPSFADRTPQPQDQDALLARAALEPVTTLPSTLDTVEHAIAGAAAGLLAKVGELAGVPAPEVDGLDDLTRNLEPHHDDNPATTGSPASAKTLTLAGSDDAAPVDETHRPEFGLDAVRKEQDDLAASPAQQLVAQGQDDDADDPHTGAKLAAGGAGALGGAALLAGAAGAKNEDNEVREPAIEDDAAEREGLVESTDADSAPTSTAPDFGTPAIEKEQAALAASPAQQLLRTDTASSSTAIQRDEAALLAGAAGAKLGATHEVEEPAKAPVDVATDKAVEAGAGVPQSPHSEALKREISEPVAPLSSSTTAADSRPSLPTPHGSTTSFSADVLAAGDGIHTPTEAPGPAVGGFGMREAGDIVATDHELDQGSTREQDGNDVVHNPAPALPAVAAVGSAAALTQDAPKDFQPYTPPVAEPTQANVELQQAAAVPVPETSASELPPTADLARVDSRSTSHTVMPSATTGALLDPSATSVPETLNAQNLDTTTPALAAPAPASPGSEQIEMDEALDEGPVMEKRDKGKGKEVLGAAALGTAGVGAGVGMKELLDGHKDGDVDAAQPDSLYDQRAFPTVPHMLDSTSASTPTDGVASRVVDPAQLAATSSTMTGPEQAGSAAAAGPTVAAGTQGMTPAMAEFAHLSEPASSSSLAHAPLTTEQPVREQPISAAEYENQKEAHLEGDQDRDGHGVPLAAAGAGLAGIGAGAAGASLLAHRNEPHAPIATGAPSALSPVAAAPGAAGAAPLAAAPIEPAAVQPVGAAQPLTAAEPVVAQPRAVEQPAVAPTPVAATPAVLAAGAGAPAAATVAAVDADEPQQLQAQQPLDNKRTPVSRFTEETFTPSATGAETPSSTRAVMGSPPSSAAATPLQSTTPTQSLFKAGILEKSPHMKIQTHKVDGHKRLHRKSLSGVVTPVGSISRRAGSGESPRGSPRQSIDTERAMPQQQHGAAGAAAPAAIAVAGATPMLVGGGAQGAQVRRAPSAMNQEGRRDRMVNNMAGVQDPTSGGYDAAPYSARSAPASPTRNVAQTPVNAAGAPTYTGLPPTGSAAAVYAPGVAAGAPPRAAQQQQQYYGQAPQQPQQIARPLQPQQQVVPPQHQHAVAQHPAAHPQQQQPHPSQQQIPTHSATTTTVDSHGREHRKLQKKHAPASAVGAMTGNGGSAVPPGSTASSEEKKSGFLSRVFGGGSK